MLIFNNDGYSIINAKLDGQLLYKDHGRIVECESHQAHQTASTSTRVYV